MYGFLSTLEGDIISIHFVIHSDAFKEDGKIKVVNQLQQIDDMNGQPKNVVMIPAAEAAKKASFDDDQETIAIGWEAYDPHSSYMPLNKILFFPSSSSDKSPSLKDSRVIVRYKGKILLSFYAPIYAAG